MKRFEFAHVAEGIARKAGALLRGFYEKGVATEYKGDVDLVTEADRASEAMIRERLAAAFPAHGIYGEEGTRDQMDSEFRWYVDPLDGTTNFAHGFPAFCVVLGLERRAAGLAKDADGEMGSGERVSVVCGPAGWNDEFCAWVSGVLRGAGAGTSGGRAGEGCGWGDGRGS